MPGGFLNLKKLHASLGFLLFFYLAFFSVSGSLFGFSLEISRWFAPDRYSQAQLNKQVAEYQAYLLPEDEFEDYLREQHKILVEQLPQNLATSQEFPLNWQELKPQDMWIYPLSGKHETAQDEYFAFFQASTAKLQEVVPLEETFYGFMRHIHLVSLHSPNLLVLHIFVLAISLVFVLLSLLLFLRKKVPASVKLLTWHRSLGLVSGFSLVFLLLTSMLGLLELGSLSQAMLAAHAGFSYLPFRIVLFWLGIVCVVQMSLGMLHFLKTRIL